MQYYIDILVLHGQILCSYSGIITCSISALHEKARGGTLTYLIFILSQDESQGTSTKNVGGQEPNLLLPGQKSILFFSNTDTVNTSVHSICSAHNVL